MIDHHYRGIPAKPGVPCKVKVWRHGRRRNLKPHSYDSRGGWNWGYSGQGPRGLAEDLLLDVLEDAAKAKVMQSEFARRVVCSWPMDRPWAIEAAEIRRIVAEIERDGGASMQRTIEITRTLLETRNRTPIDDLPF